MQTNIYLELTEQFNKGRLRAILSSGQAVVLHRLAIMSKDGDWIIREDQEAIEHILRVLDSRGARYRFGAPLALPWLEGGWSSHFEFVQDKYSPFRVRTDFVSRPPRLSPDDLTALWNEQDEAASDQTPVVDMVRLAKLKQTNRERDYAVIGELARRMESVRDQLLFSRSPRDLMDLAANHPNLVKNLSSTRPVLGVIEEGREALETALDAERRTLARVNEDRLLRYGEAAADWLSNWPSLDKRLAGRPLFEAHQLMVNEATILLPAQPLRKDNTHDPRNRTPPPP